MLKDAIFRTAIIFSISVHAAVILPDYFITRSEDKKVERKIDLNYIIIHEADIVRDKEVYAKFSDNIPHEEGRSESPNEMNIPEPVPVDGSNRDVQKSVEKETDRTLSEEKAFLEYYNILREKIRAELFSVIEKGDKCNATLYFTVNPDGDLMELNGLFPDTAVRVKKKVLKGARSAGPFPPFPSELGHSPAKFSIVINIV